MLPYRLSQASSMPSTVRNYLDSPDALTTAQLVETSNTI